MATARCTQACFHAAGTHAVLHPQGERWESEVEGQGSGTHHPGINGVRWTVASVDGGATLMKRKWRQLSETEELARNRERVGGL